MDAVTETVGVEDIVIVWAEAVVAHIIVPLIWKAEISIVASAGCDSSIIRILAPALADTTIIVIFTPAEARSVRIEELSFFAFAAILFRVVHCWDVGDLIAREPSIYFWSVDFAFVGGGKVFVDKEVAMISTRLNESWTDNEGTMKFEAQVEFLQDLESWVQAGEEWDSVIGRLDTISLDLLKKSRHRESIDAKVMHLSKSKLLSNSLARVGKPSHSEDSICSLREEEVVGILVVIEHLGK